MASGLAKELAGITDPAMIDMLLWRFKLSLVMTKGILEHEEYHKCAAILARDIACLEDDHAGE